MRGSLSPLAALAAGAWLLGAAAPAGAADELGRLLDGLAPAAKRPPAGGVAVTGWVEGGPGAGELVVRVEARGAAKLVAEPGVTATPLPREGVAWPSGPVARDAAGAAYFGAPVELRLPFSAADAGPVGARIEYAYCIVDQQCLFGEAVVSASVAVAPPACAVAAGRPTAAC